jgi:hypothetical protein
MKPDRLAEIRAMGDENHSRFTKHEWWRATADLLEALAVLERRLAEATEALRQIAGGPRDVVFDAPDGHPAIAVRTDSVGYSECLRIAREALRSERAAEEAT